MNDTNDKCRENRDAVDISIWENEGGASDRYDMNHHYGRRIEPDGSWAIYHVFTGHRQIWEADPWLGSAKQMPLPE